MKNNFWHKDLSPRGQIIVWVVFILFNALCAYLDYKWIESRNDYSIEIKEGGK